MKNFKQENYKNNRNSLRYLITNPFKEFPSITIENVFKSKSFIKNKTEKYTTEGCVLFYELNIANKVGLVSVLISPDHLMTVKVSYNKLKEIKTREMSEVVALIHEVLFT